MAKPTPREVDVKRWREEILAVLGGKLALLEPPEGSDGGPG